MKKGRKIAPNPSRKGAGEESIWLKRMLNANFPLGRGALVIAYPCSIEEKRE